jgi:polyhydroxybutyrate depolymerase
LKRVFRLLLRAAGIYLALLITVAIGAATYYSLQYGTNGTLLVDGKERQYLLHVPKKYDRSKPAPLVISLHGAMNWPGFQRDTTRWSELADKEGFLVVYPAGTGFGPRTWDMNGYGNPQTMKDVRFIAALIDKLRAEHNIDAARIYADGLSNGGGMAFILSCTLSDRIAAFGTVSAAQIVPQSVCKAPRPAPLISFHGTADHVVPYEGGQPWIAPLPFPDQREWTAAWAARNRCAPKPSVTMAAADVQATEYGGCAGNASVVLYTVRGAGHQWPGGRPVPLWLVAQMTLMGLPIGPYSNSVNATRTLWAFFRAHPLQK